MGTILVVDDERSMREFLSICLKRAGHEVSTFDNGRALIEHLENNDADLVITDLRIPGELDGLGVLAESKKTRPQTQVLMVTAYASADTAISAMKSGAYDYLTKPFKIDEISVVVERALERRHLIESNAALRQKVEGSYRLDSILGKSKIMQRIFSMIRRIAPTKTNVLITGESGVGKELVARALHNESPRCEAPFVAINCGAIPETLLESELFGHVRGSFTGATNDKLGLFQAASGGTLFLDEVGELPTAVQVKLLRALQERKVKQVGGIKEVDVDVRLVAATNRDLEKEVETGAFRQDLYYRLNVIDLHVPPLRQRGEDIPLLVDHFLKRFAVDMGKGIHGIAPDALRTLIAYGFPGNVRELENIIERAVTLETTPNLTTESLPTLRATSTPVVTDVPESGNFPTEGISLDSVMADYEREWIRRALAESEGVRKTAARKLGITFRSLRYRLSKLGIDPGNDKDQGSEAAS